MDPTETDILDTLFSGPSGWLPLVDPLPLERYLEEREDARREAALADANIREDEEDWR